MADKTWVAAGLRMGKLTIMPARAGTIAIERRYQFEDAGGEILGQIKPGRLNEDVEVADLPQDVLNALQTIDVWTENRAMEQEGMLDE